MDAIVDFSVLEESQRQSIELFDCGEETINDYLRKESELSQDDKRLLIYVENNRVVGFVSMSLANFKVSIQNDRTVEMDPIVYVYALGVDKEFQGNKIGSLLLKAVLSIAVGIDNLLPLKGVRLESMRDATDFYEKFGFIYLTRSPEEDFTSKVFYMDLSMSYIRQLDID
ncbi:TPA: GNAT family N-acetyltransferase [Streptococcus suis]